MRKIRKIYICDQCGAIALQQYKYCMFGDVIKVEPKDWGKFAGMDFCPNCYAAIKDVFDKKEGADDDKP